jgi:hypothetical protein
MSYILTQGRGTPGLQEHSLRRTGQRRFNAGVERGIILFSKSTTFPTRLVARPHFDLHHYEEPIDVEEGSEDNIRYA